MKSRRSLYLIILMTVIALFTSQVNAQEKRMINFIKEEKNMNEILSMVKASGKTGLLYFTSDGCIPCQMMQKDVFINDSVRTYVEYNFLSFWIDNHNKYNDELGKYYDIHAVPTMVFIKITGEVVDKIIGYYPPKEFMKALIKSTRKEDTIESLRTAYEANPNDEDVAWKYAIKLFDTFNYKNALPLYENFISRSLKDSSRESRKYLNLAVCYERTNKTAEAIDIYEKAFEKGYITSNSERVNVLGRLVELCYTQRRYDSSIKYGTKLSDFQKEIKDATIAFNAKRGLRYLPFAYARINQWDMGKQTLEKNLKEAAADTNYMLLSEYGQLCMIGTLYEKEVLPWAEKALELYNIFIDTEGQKAAKIVETEKQNEANKRIELIKTNLSYVLMTYGSLLGRNSEYEKAIEIYKRLLEIPESKYLPQRSKDEKFDASANIAALLLKSGKTDEGNSQLQQLLKESMNNPIHLFRLSYIFFQYKIMLKDALGWAKHAVDLTKDGDGYRPLILYTYGKLLYENGAVEKALEMATKANELSPYYIFKDDIDKYKAAFK